MDDNSKKRTKNNSRPDNRQITLAEGATTPDNQDMPDPRIILPPSVIEALRKAGATEVDKGDGKDRSDANLRPHLSYSQISTYLRCGMQYKLKYIDHEPDKPKVSLALGKGGHAAIEKNVKRKIKSQTDSPVEEVVQWGSDFMDKELSALPPSEIEKDVEPGSTKDRFLGAIRVFQTRDAPKITPVGAEVRFLLDMNQFQPEPLDEPIRPVLGYVDNINIDHETLVTPYQGMSKTSVKDSKFITRRRTQLEVNTSPQLSLYAGWWKTLTGMWPTQLGYQMFLPGNTKEGPDSTPLLREPEHMTPAALESRLRRLAYQFRKVEEGIRAEIFIPTDDPISCSWCPVRDRCQESRVTDFQAASIRQKTEPK